MLQVLPCQPTAKVEEDKGKPAVPVVDKDDEVPDENDAEAES